MRLHLDDILEEGLTVSFSEPVSAFEELVTLHDGEVSIVAPVEGEVGLLRNGKQVRLAGTAKTRIQTGCSRCLCRFEQTLLCEFELTAMLMSEERTAEAEDDIELDSESLEQILLEGDELNLAPVIAEQVLLALPLQPICREECRGLCAKCGCDLNNESCDCHLEPAAGPFAVLKDFKVDK